jgi:hypothetical protein
MRLAVLARVAIAVIAATIALLDLLALLPPTWKPYAPFISVAIALTIYAWTEWTNAVLARKETTAYRRHIDDLHGFANQAKTGVGQEPLGRVMPINIDGTLGQGFSKHFPKATAMMAEWNQVANGYMEKANTFMYACSAEAQRIGLGGLAFAQVLNSIGNRRYDLPKLTWFADRGHLYIGSDIEHDDWYTVASLPPTAAETEVLLLRIWNCCAEFRELPQVAAWVTASGRAGALWKPLYEELEAVEVNHDPAGRCSLCPR